MSPAEAGLEVSNEKPQQDRGAKTYRCVRGGTMPSRHLADGGRRPIVVARRRTAQFGGGQRGNVRPKVATDSFKPAVVPVSSRAAAGAFKGVIFVGAVRRPSLARPPDCCALGQGFARNYLPKCFLILRSSDQRRHAWKAPPPSTMITPAAMVKSKISSRAMPPAGMVKPLHAAASSLIITKTTTQTDGHRAGAAVSRIIAQRPRRARPDAGRRGGLSSALGSGHARRLSR
jgi:hypothetical protein